MDTCIIVSEPGGPEALRAERRSPKAPGPGEVRLRHRAIGVNFLDIYHRSGLYPLPGGTPGVEGAGVVEAVGEGVTTLSPGQLVVYGGPPVGAYASARLMDADRLFPLPDGVTAEIAAAAFFKGLTAHMLLTRVYPVGQGTQVLVHAAGGGLGGILVRWAKSLGAVVIGTVSNPAKAEAARAFGADHLIVGRNADLSAAVAELTQGRGVDYAIDGIGGETLAKTFACVRRFGVVASVGQAAGPIPPVPVEALGPVRALALARPSVMAYAAEPETYRSAGEAVLAKIAGGLTATVGGLYRLEAAAAAHADLEAGRTTGSLLLIP